MPCIPTGVFHIRACVCVGVCVCVCVCMCVCDIHVYMSRIYLKIPDQFTLMTPEYKNGPQSQLKKKKHRISLNINELLDIYK